MTDPFAALKTATNRHRAAHGCGAYPFSDGSILGVLAGAAQPGRILELGTALGYTATWFAHAAPHAAIDTIEGDETHVALARANLAARGFGNRVTVHHGDFEATLGHLDAPYDLAFFDGFAPSPQVLARLIDLLSPRGMIIAANLGLGRTGAQAYRALVADPERWITSTAIENGGVAVSIRR